MFRMQLVLRRAASRGTYRWDFAHSAVAGHGIYNTGLFAFSTWLAELAPRSGCNVGTCSAFPCPAFGPAELSLFAIRMSRAYTVHSWGCSCRHDIRDPATKSLATE